MKTPDDDHSRLAKIESQPVTKRRVILVAIGCVLVFLLDAARHFYEAPPSQSWGVLPALVLMVMLNVTLRHDIVDPLVREVRRLREQLATTDQD